MTMISRPIAGSNAIEAVAFVINFVRPLSVREIETVMALETLLKDDLPAAAKVTDVHVNVSDQPTGQTMALQTQRVGGISLQLVRPDGTPSWALRVAGSTVLVNCWSYDSWSNVWPKAKKYLAAALGLLQVEQNFVTTLISQTTDKFVYERADANEVYDIHELFKANCPYLTPAAVDAGDQWHVHQGWFDVTHDPNEKILNVLNLSSGAIGPSSWVTTIDHQAHTQFRSALLLPGALLAEDGGNLDRIFSEHHRINRTIIESSLTEKKLIDIGLLKNDPV